MKQILVSIGLFLALLPAPSFSQQFAQVEHCSCKAITLETRQQLGPRLRLPRLSQETPWQALPEGHADMSVPIQFTPNALAQVGRSCRHAVWQGPNS